MTANTIRHKRNSTPSVVPSSGQLVAGELAINTYDGKVFLRREDNAVIDIVAAQTSGVYAPLISPSFTGIPIGPNPSISNNSNQLATTNFVQSIFSSQNILSKSIINVSTNNYSSFNIPGGYTVGRLDLFQNGVKLLENSDFTANDGVSVTLFKPAPSGSSLEYLINYSTSSYANFSGVTASIGNFTSSLFVNSVPVSLSGHTHTSDSITNFNSSVNILVSGTYAPISGKLNQFSSTLSSELASIIPDETGSGVLVFNDSPVLTGIPIVPTAPTGTNTNQIASTSFVRNEISNLVAFAPSSLDTLNELATALGNDANFSTTVTNTLANKANLSGANFTGAISSISGNFINALTVNNTGVSLIGHTHTSSQITDFNTSVNLLLPTIFNSGDNRLLTSTGSTTGINAESGLTFDGSNFNVDANLVFDSFTESVVSNGSSGTAKTISLTLGTVHTCTLTGNCIFTMPTPVAGKSFTLFLNTGSGGFTSSFTGVLWSSSSGPTITTTANKVDILSFISDGTYWYGSYSQNYG